MIPLTIDKKELKILDRPAPAPVADAIIKKAGVKLKYMVGTMIEMPRAALLADEIAEVAEFFSFGTNDLTQMTLGLSRDDAGRFLPDYVDEKKAAGIFDDDPFQSLDQDGVGMLVKMAHREGPQTTPEPQGRHLRRARRRGQVASSSATASGMNYVSCSPFRVPIARLAAAQAVIKTAGPGPAEEKGGQKGQGRAQAGPGQDKESPGKKGGAEESREKSQAGQESQGKSRKESQDREERQKEVTHTVRSQGAGLRACLFFRPT